MRINLPGAAWAALITLLTGALSGWLTDWVQAPWVPLAVVGLSTLAKLVQLYVEMQQSAVRTTVTHARGSLWARVLWG